MIKREGLCIYDNTKIDTLLSDKDDEGRFYFNNIVSCPICAQNIRMVIKEHY